MTVHAPLAVQPSGADPNQVTTAQEFRNHMTAMLAAVNGFEGGEGVCGINVPSAGVMSGGFAVTQRGAGANGSVDVAAGHLYVNGDDISQQGMYECWNDGTVNITVPLSPPAQRVHRLVVQIQDKLSNATWSGYTAVISLLQDTGSGTPALPNSAITLALITVNPSDVSVLNAAIADYRRSPGAVTCAMTTSTPTARNSSALNDDPYLQLWGLRHNAYYNLFGYVRYDSATGADFHSTWRTLSSGEHVFYSTNRAFTDGTVALPVGHTEADTIDSQGAGQGTDRGIMFYGTIFTGTTTPNNALIFQWGQRVTTSGSGNAARVLQGSSLFAWPVN